MNRDSAAAMRAVEEDPKVDALEHEVLAQYRADADAERVARVAATKLHMRAIRQIVRALRPVLSNSAKRLRFSSKSSS